MGAAHLTSLLYQPLLFHIFQKDPVNTPHPIAPTSRGWSAFALLALAWQEIEVRFLNKLITEAWPSWFY